MAIKIKVHRLVIIVIPNIPEKTGDVTLLCEVTWIAQTVRICVVSIETAARHLSIHPDTAQMPSEVPLEPRWPQYK